MPTKRRPKAELVEQERSEAAWVTEMHEHFHRTGLYRAEDLQRVLGDPRESVQVRAEADLILAGAVHEPAK